MKYMFGREATAGTGCPSTRSPRCVWWPSRPRRRKPLVLRMARDSGPRAGRRGSGLPASPFRTGPWEQVHAARCPEGPQREARFTAGARGRGQHGRLGTAGHSTPTGLSPHVPYSSLVLERWSRSAKWTAQSVMGHRLPLGNQLLYQRWPRSLLPRPWAPGVAVGRSQEPQ